MRFEDQATSEAFEEIAALLAAAYNRYSRVRRVPVESGQGAVNHELDNGREVSRHVNCG
jgi:hypothetical protein